MTYTHHDRETYGERRLRLWRSGEHGELTKGERAELEEFDAWDAAHPREVDALEALVGATVALREAHRTWAVDVTDESVRALVRSHAKSTRMVVRARMRERLLATAEDGFVLLVRREWLAVITPAPVATPPEAPTPEAPPAPRVSARAMPESDAKARAKTHDYNSACNCFRCRKTRRRARILGVPVETLVRAPRRL